MSYLPELRDALVAAADRQAAATTTPLHRHPDTAAGAPGGSTSRIRVPAMLRAAPVLAAVLATVLVLGIVIVQTRGQSTRHPGASPPITRAVRQPTLSALLAILRRPQRPSDLRGHDLARYLSEPQPPFFGAGSAIRSDIRRVAAPWSDGVYLLTLRPPTLNQVLRANPHLSRAAAERTARLGVPELAILEQAGGSVCCSTARQIASSGELMAGGGTLAPAAGAVRRHSRQWAHLVLVVPDGVARVRFEVVTGFPTPQTRHRRRLRIVVAVRDNVATVALSQACCTRTGLVWFAPDGRVLKRIGSPN